ncbi:MAG: 7-cyano-7-deazaguanine synthase [Elusimicrobia bacterium]|nr:7-cyano-7-deazaguanine synthase [Elusimicrobiota bacterium]
MGTENIDQQIVNEIRFFDFIAQNIWPKVRWLFGSFITPRCQRCTISSKVPEVTLQDGICNLCQAHEARKDRAEQAWHDKYIAHQAKELDQLLKDHQNKGKGRWDALVLFSGGKDSVYMLSRIKKDYPKLRVLLMTWNNGFYSKVALDQAREIAAKLDLDHMVFKPTSSVYKTLYRYTLQNVEMKGSYQTVDRLDGTLNQFLGFYFAYQMNIPLVLTGVDFAQELIMQFHSYYKMPFEDMCSRTLTDRMERRSGFKISAIFSEEDQKLFWDGTGKDKERIPQYIIPLVAWRPDKGAVQVELARQGLLPKRNSSPILTNNQVLGVMTAIDIKTIGYCSFEPEFAEMIRFKENDPVYWRNVFELVELAAKQKILMNKLISKVLGKLGLTTDQVGLSK